MTTGMGVALFYPIFLLDLFSPEAVLFIITSLLFTCLLVPFMNYWLQTNGPS